MSTPDLTLTRSGETMMTQIEGNTDEGTAFVDSAYSNEMHVVDSGRIILPTEQAEELEKTAKETGLTVEHVEGI